jgi:hypothetical protein
MGDVAVPALVATRAGQQADAEEKAKVRDDAVRKNSRLAATKSAMQLDMTKKAVNLRAIKDSLKNYSIKLQAHVARSKLLQKMTAPLGVKPVSELRAAAQGRAKRCLLALMISRSQLASVRCGETVSGRPSFTFHV